MNVYDSFLPSRKCASLIALYFDVPKGLNYAQIVTYLTEAKTKQIKVTLLEGWRIKDIAAKLEEKISIDRSDIS